MEISLQKDWQIITAFVIFVIYTVRNEGKLRYLLKKVKEIEEGMGNKFTSLDNSMRDKTDRLEKEFSLFVQGIDLKLDNLIISVEILKDREARRDKDGK